MLANRTLGMLVTLLMIGLGAALIATTGEGHGPLQSACNLRLDERIPIPRLPYLIQEPGSYFVTDNLTGVAASDGITIDADSVTLDLNGFTLQGVARSGSGVFIMPNRIGAVIHDGTLRSWGGHGVMAEMSESCSFQDLQLHNNALGGLFAGGRSLVERCHARDNGLGTTGTGIRCERMVRVTDCIATENAGEGFAFVSSCRVRDCEAQANGSHGFTIRGNNVVSECSAVANLGNGFEVTENHNRLEANFAIGQPIGFHVDFPNNILIRNNASGNNSYVIVPGNHYGEILVSPGDGFMNCNPWANFEL